MLGRLALLLACAELCSGARIAERRYSQEINLHHDKKKTEAGDLFAFKLLNSYSNRVEGAVVTIDAGGSTKKQECITDRYGLVCLRIPSGTNTVQVKATKPTCSTEHKTIQPQSYCKSNPSQCLAQGIVSGFGSDCKGNDLYRDDAAEKAFCNNALQNGVDSYGCKDYDPSNVAPAVTPTGGGSLNPTSATACPAAVMISGEETTQGAFMGIFKRIATDPQGKDVYQNKHRKYLHYDKGFKWWLVGDSLDLSQYGLKSALFEGTQCPNSATGWALYDAARQGFVKSQTLQVVEQACPGDGFDCFDNTFDDDTENVTDDPKDAPVASSDTSTGGSPDNSGLVRCPAGWLICLLWCLVALAHGGDFK